MPSVRLNRKEIQIAIQNYVKEDLNPDGEWKYEMKFEPAAPKAVVVNCERGFLLDD